MVEHPQIDRLIEGTAQRLSQLVDIDTVIGKPVYSSGGTEIIPLAKVTMGYLSGGGEYGTAKIVHEDGSIPFAGGAGTVVSMKPVGFLIDDGKGCRLIQLGDGPLDRVIEKAGELLEQLTERYARS